MWYGIYMQEQLFFSVGDLPAISRRSAFEKNGGKKKNAAKKTPQKSEVIESLLFHVLVCQLPREGRRQPRGHRSGGGGAGGAAFLWKQEKKLNGVWGSQLSMLPVTKHKRINFPLIQTRLKKPKNIYHLNLLVAIPSYVIPLSTCACSPPPRAQPRRRGYHDPWKWLLQSFFSKIELPYFLGTNLLRFGLWSE